MIKEIVDKITEANHLYRIGKPIMSDKEFDILVEELRNIDPDNGILNTIGFIIKDDDRKRKLSIPMFSMNKVKSMDEIYEWCRLKNIDTSQSVVITPKYDGISLCVNEINKEATTRGNGTYGQKSDEHYKLIGNHLENLPQPWPKSGGFQFTYGEVMMPKKVFVDKYSVDYANPRNLVAGLLNSKEVTNPLKDTVYIKYGAVVESEFEGQYTTKSDLLKSLNDGQEIKVPFKVISIKDLTHEILFDLFKSWSQDFEIDGLIVEVNSLQTQDQLGRETSSNNPCWARAYKSPDFEQVAETTIIGISWNISKNGSLRPTIHVNPVPLDGVVVSNVTGNNARFVKDLGLGVGAKVRVVRSGMVIPLIKEVIEPVEFKMPDIENIEWDIRGVDIITKEVTSEQQFKEIVAFFEILEADNIGEGNLKILWNSGYRTIRDILNLTKDDLISIDGFGERKSEIIINSIKKSITNVSLSKVQHASNCYVGLGSKKLQLLEHFGYLNKPSKEDIIKIDGFAETSATSYLNGFDKFREFIKNLPIIFTESKKIGKISSELDDISFCFTGLRRKDLEIIIESRGGRIASGVSKGLNYLVVKDLGSGSSKLIKAEQLGVTLLNVVDLEKMLGL